MARAKKASSNLIAKKVGGRRDAVVSCTLGSTRISKLLIQRHFDFGTPGAWSA
jgi:hypothetical protein